MSCKILTLKKSIMKKSFLLISLLAITSIYFTSCTPDSEACFNATSDAIEDENNPIVGEKISFENCSENADSYYWDFDDDEDSETESPTHTYTKGGEYEVTLETTNKKGTDGTSLTINVLSLDGDWEGYIILYSSDDEDYIETEFELEIEQEGEDLEGTFLSFNLVSSTVDEYEIELRFDLTFNSGSEGYYLLEGEINEDYDEMEGTFYRVIGSTKDEDSMYTWYAEKTSSKSCSIKSNKNINKAISSLR